MAIYVIVFAPVWWWPSYERGTRWFTVWDDAETNRIITLSECRALASVSVYSVPLLPPVPSIYLSVSVCTLFMSISLLFVFVFSLLATLLPLPFFLYFGKFVSIAIHQSRTYPSMLLIFFFFFSIRSTSSSLRRLSPIVPVFVFPFCVFFYVFNSSSISLRLKA